MSGYPVHLAQSTFKPLYTVYVYIYIYIGLFAMVITTMRLQGSFSPQGKNHEDINKTAVTINTYPYQQDVSIFMYVNTAPPLPDNKQTNVK